MPDPIVPADELDDSKVLEGDEPEKKVTKSEDADVDTDVEEPTDDEEESLEDKEEEVEEEEEEDKDKEDVEDDLGPRRPSFKEIKGKYPDLFKDFPDLREAFFRESEYTKIFPTVDDAHEAVEALESLSVIRDKVLEGDATAILEATKEADAAAYSKMVSNMLPALYKMDQEAYVKAITPTLENMVRSAYREGKSSGNEDLENSALHVSKWFFGTEDVALGKTTTVKTATEESPEVKRLAKERQEFETSKYNEAYSAVIENRDESMERLVLKGLDPDNELTPYVRDKLVRDTIQRIDNLLLKDGSHMSLMNRKWRRAKREGYSKDSLKSIVSAYQARAKSLVPSVRAKLRDAALGKVTKKGAQRATDVAARREVPAGRASSSVVRLPSPRDVDWRKSSDEDILAGKITTRR